MTGAAGLTGTYPPMLRSIAAHGLPGTVLEHPTEPLPEADFIRLHAMVRAHKLTGLFWTALTTGAFPATTTQFDRVAESHTRVMSGVLLLEARLLHTVDALTEAGIQVRALKGSASSHLDYPDPSMRSFGDVDLLVPGDAFDDAVAVLAREGCRRRYPDPRPGFFTRFGKGTSLRTPDGLELDLHRTFTMGPFGERLGLDLLWETRDSYELGGMSVPALSVEARLLHACYHAVLGDRVPQLMPLRDIAQILLNGSVDWRSFASLMRASQGEAVVARGVRGAWAALELADVLVVTAWAQAFEESPRATADLAVYGPGSSYAALSVAAARAVPGLGQKASFLLALAVPQRSYLDGRHRGQLRRLRQGVADVRRVRARP